MKKISVLLFLLLINHCFSQSTFHHGYCIKGNYKGQVIEDIQRTNDGGYAIMEEYYDSIALLKIDGAGEINWMKVHTSTNRLFPSGFEQVKDEGFVFAGCTADYSHAPDIFLLKTDKNGNRLWTKQYKNNTESACVYSIKQTADKGFILGGNTGTPALIITKTDSIGSLMWCKKYTSFGNKAEYRYPKTKQTKDGGYITIWVDGFNKIVLLKTNNTGDVQWSKYFSSNLSPNGTSCELTNDNGFIISSASGSNLFLIKTNATGDILWSKSFSGQENVGSSSVKQTNDSGYIVSFNDRNGANMLKTDTAGSMQWCKKFKNRFISCMLQNPDNSYIAGGSFGGIAVVNAGVVIKMDSSGNTTCDEETLSLSESAFTFQTSILNPVANLLDFITTDITYSERNVTSVSIPCEALTIAGESSPSKIIVFPNPSSGQFILTQLPMQSTVEIFDMLGNVIFQSLVITDNLVINLSGKSRGIYFYRVVSENYLVQSGKLSLD